VPDKSLDGGTLTVSTPRSWSWRLKLGLLLIRAASWVFGARFESKSRRASRAEREWEELGRAVAECDHARLLAAGYDECPGCGEGLSTKPGACGADHVALLCDGFLECPSCEVNLSMKRLSDEDKCRVGASS
jgi:hypothetical protein